MAGVGERQGLRRGERVVELWLRHRARDFSPSGHRGGNEGDQTLLRERRPEDPPKDAVDPPRPDPEQLQRERRELAPAGAAWRLRGLHPREPGRSEAAGENRVCALCLRRQDEAARLQRVRVPVVEVPVEDVSAGKSKRAAVGIRPVGRGDGVSDELVEPGNGVLQRHAQRPVVRSLDPDRPTARRVVRAGAADDPEIGPGQRRSASRARARAATSAGRPAPSSAGRRSSAGSCAGGRPRRGRPAERPTTPRDRERLRAPRSASGPRTARASRSARACRPPSPDRASAAARAARAAGQPCAAAAEEPQPASSRTATRPACARRCRAAST